MQYIEVSAKTSDNVDSAFENLASNILGRIQQGTINPEDEVICGKTEAWNQDWQKKYRCER